MCVVNRCDVSMCVCGTGVTSVCVGGGDSFDISMCVWGTGVTSVCVGDSFDVSMCVCGTGDANPGGRRGPV